jgi:hypothetical protein
VIGVGQSKGNDRSRNEDSHRDGDRDKDGGKDVEVSSIYSHNVNKSLCKQERNGN